MVVNEVIVVSVPALASIATRHMAGDCDPVPGTEFKHEVAERFVFVHCKLAAADVFGVKNESH
jgi:hypothetical protein